MFICFSYLKDKDSSDEDSNCLKYLFADLLGNLQINLKDASTYLVGDLCVVDVLLKSCENLKL